MVVWEYKVVTFQNPEIPSLEAELAGWGKAGWELVTLSSTVKSGLLTNNALVGVLKRPGDGEADRDAPAPQRADQSGWI